MPNQRHFGDGTLGKWPARFNWNPIARRCCF
jgi:hypothetical protein